MIDYNKLAKIYSDHLDYYEYKPNKCQLDKLRLDADERREHLNYMLQQMKTETDEGKLNRWMGFVQGALWFDSRFSIDELRDHVNSCKIVYESIPSPEWKVKAGFNRGVGLGKLKEITEMVHEDIANNTISILQDGEEQRVYFELHQIHSNSKINKSRT